MSLGEQIFREGLAAFNKWRIQNDPTEQLDFLDALEAFSKAV